MTDHDDGVRCSSHVGEIFPPRCLHCDAERRELLAETTASNAARLADHPEQREPHLAAIAMVTAALTGAARPHAILASYIPAGNADGAQYLNDVVDVLASFTASRLKVDEGDPLALLQALARAVEGVKPYSL